MVSPAPPRESRRPIDTFFSSLAEDCGHKAIGIILSGVGSDGALGVRKIKEHGGLTLAQAEFDHVAQGGMPRSAADTGMVDHIVPVEAMPALLVDHHQHLGAVPNTRTAMASGRTWGSTWRRLQGYCAPACGGAPCGTAPGKRVHDQVARLGEALDETCEHALALLPRVAGLLYSRGRETITSGVKSWSRATGGF